MYGWDGFNGVLLMLVNTMAAPTTGYPVAATWRATTGDQGRTSLVKLRRRAISIAVALHEVYAQTQRGVAQSTQRYIVMHALHPSHPIADLFRGLARQL